MANSDHETSVEQLEVFIKELKQKAVENAPTTNTKGKVPELRDLLSQVPICISMYFRDTKLAIGTAFTYLYEGQLYLVTNWHNVTGREPDTLKPKSKDAGIPDRFRVQLPISVKASSIKDLNFETNCMQWLEAEIPLYEDYEDISDSPTKSLWYEHPQYGHKVDVVVIPFPFELPEEVFILPANDLKLNLSAVLLRPSLDVFVLGFPRGMSGGACFPVWKRGSIASEPEIDVDDLPKILIDTATREGMSGSPVYICQIGYFQSEEEYETGGYKRCLGEGRRFVGVYSGRIGDDNFQAQLGIVWKSDVIEEIIQAAQIGRSSFDL